MNNMMIFNNSEFGSVRTLKNNEGKVYFVARDIAEVLGYVKLDAMYRRLSDRQRIKVNPQNLANAGFPQIDAFQIEPNPNIKNMVLITEGGLYKAILGSTLPSAERFQDWVTDEVLPQIRMTGGYIPVQSGDSDAEIMAKALLVAQKTLDKKDEIIGILEPRAKNYDLLMDSKSNLDFSEFVKSAKLTIGRNRFIDVLRENKIIRCKPNTEPYQQFVEAGYFEVIQKVVNGHSVSKTTITKKGVDWLIKKCDGWDIITVSRKTPAFRHEECQVSKV